MSAPATKAPKTYCRKHYMYKGKAKPRNGWCAVCQGIYETVNAEQIKYEEAIAHLEAHFSFILAEDPNRPVQSLNP